MFSTITWETFLTTVALVVGGYYSITALLLYHKEIIHRFKSRSSKILAAPSPAREKQDSPGIMGNIREENITTRSSSVSAEDVSVDTSDSDSQEAPEMIKILKVISVENEGLLTGSVSDLLQDIRTVFQLVTEYKSDKTECESLFRTLLLRYPHVRKTSFRRNIAEYIYETGLKQFAFPVQLEEVNRWWDEHPTK